MKVRELANEGWITFESSDNLDREISNEEIDELVFHTWGWALKLNVQKLKNNSFLAERAKNTDFSKVIEKIHRRIKK